MLGELVTALKIMDADEINDTIFGTGLTVREKSQEFLRRLETDENLPLMTSCRPAWIKYMKKRASIISHCRILPSSQGDGRMRQPIFYRLPHSYNLAFSIANTADFFKRFYYKMYA